MQVPYQIDDFSNVFFQKVFVHLIAIIWSTKYVHFNEVNFIYFFFLFATSTFGVMAKKPLANPRS